MELDEIGKFHLEDTEQKERLQALKTNAGLDELMYLSTCNRVEFYFVSDAEMDDDYLIDFFHAFKPNCNETWLMNAVRCAETHAGKTAIQHVFNVASSIESMVVGEREIITQVRSAYERSNELDLTGDTIRLVMKKTIEAAKAVYTQTGIATNPVSVVSLAYRTLKEHNVKLDARFLIIGAGQTNTNMSKFLSKHGFTNFVVFNRTLANGERLASDLNGGAQSLSELQNYKGGFDVMITCTSAAEHIITPSVYEQLLDGETDKKIVIDLAVPQDFDVEILKNNHVELIAVDDLKTIADKNLREREKELGQAEAIIEEFMTEFQKMFKARKVELAMSEVPVKVKEIKDNALNTVFAKDLDGLDEHSKEVLDKILNYVEKKYISVPMKMAKEILLEEEKNG
jgi:glutamyl-tRNA reductase